PTRVVSEGLPDAEMNPPPPRLRRAVDEQAGNRIELIADIEAHRTNRRLIPEAGTDCVAQIAERYVSWSGPDVAGVDKDDAAPVAAEHGAQFRARRQRAVAA